MIRLRSLLSVLLAGLISSSAAHAQEKIELRLHLEKGQTFDQVVAMQQKMSQTYSGTRTDSEITTRFGIHNEVLEADEKSAIIIKTTYNYATSQVSVNSGQAERYDSRKPPKIVPMSAMATAAFVGQSLTTTVSPRGEVQKVEGGEAIMERLMDLMKLPAEVRAEISKTTHKASKTQPGQFIHFAQLPPNTIAIGDSWTAKNNRSAIAPSFLSTKYTLLARQGRRIILSLRSSALTPITYGEFETTIKTEFKASGGQIGILRIDEKSGLIKEYEIHQRVAGRFVLKGQGKTKVADATDSGPIYTKTTLRGWTFSPRETLP